MKDDRDELKVLIETLNELREHLQLLIDEPPDEAGASHVSEFSGKLDMVISEFLRVKTGE
jgi:hypothetical protein